MTDPVSSNPLLRPLTRVVVTLWVIFAVALAVKLACWPNKHTVFPVYHAAVQATMAGDSPYDRVGDLDLFRYPPPSLWLFFPFGVLPVRVGGALWGICSVGMTLWGVLRLWRWALPGAIAWSDRRVAVYLLVTLLVASRGLWNAQANGLLGGFIFLAVAELARARTWLSSFAMAAALLLKPTMLSVPMLLAAWRPAWGLRLLGALGAIVLLTAVPSPRQSAWLWEKWVEHGKSSAGERRAAFRDAWTLGLTAVDLVRP
ncbi:MAG: glycosyltransferase family 87 protein, partial [Gemmataceae bacterium]